MLRFAIPPQWESGDQDLRVEGTLRNDTLSGTMVDPAGNRLGWTGHRAPTLRRAAPPRWASPITLFDGGDLSHWLNPTDNWRVADGVLANDTAGGHLVTETPTGTSSCTSSSSIQEQQQRGVPARSARVADRGSPPSRVQTEALGAIYGFLPPSESAAKVRTSGRRTTSP